MASTVAHRSDRAVAVLAAFWRTNDSCSVPNLTTAGVATTSIAACPGSRTVELISIAGAGHQWPGGAPKSKVQQLLGTDPPSTVLNATKTIWAFFAGHRAPGK